jgi:hypothetical protein
MSTAPEVVDPLAELEAERAQVMQEMMDLAVRSFGVSDREREAINDRRQALREKG